MFVIGNTIRKAVVTVMIGNYIHRVVIIEGSLFSREYNIMLEKLMHVSSQVQDCPGMGGLLEKRKNTRGS